MEQVDDPERAFSLRMTTRQWRHLDGAVDSEVSIAAESDDPHQVVQTGSDIREAGWDQVAHWTPGVAGSGDWPADDEEVAVKLSRRQWELAARCAAHWAAVAGSVGHEQEAAVLRSVNALVLDGLNAESA
ncbi:hypothetical protein O7614_30240 [Micromonospora sp. WMMD961]|uniref:hypothetical protein n=1 Tax=Micromonospora sp. WMMD961 TaxID=3016100 RepID=UPI0024173A9F|nr:hypothetical protein [Micromonospora sp. WMMD961]MDG4783939.1 hypothetical protein [Micromonospora sp. WMMD961]